MKRRNFCISKIFLILRNMDRCFWSIFTGVLVLTFAQMTMADSLSLRCEGELIEEGDTTYEVSSRCGQPDHKQIHYEERYHEKPNTYVVRKRKDTSWTSPFLVKKIIKIETWTYNFGPTRFIYYLFFEDGELVNIETGDYGFPEK